MPSILGEWFSVEIAIRALLWLAFVVTLLGGFAWLVGVLLRRRRRQVAHVSRIIDGPVPSHDALRKWCQDRFITAATKADAKRGTAEGLFAADDCRYWHTLIDILDARLVVHPHGRIEKGDRS